MSTDLSPVIVAKSDQLNADDLISGPIIIEISGVNVKAGSEQPTSISYVGDNGKPYKPGRSMSRILVAAWGAEGTDYVGRKLQLFRDPDVRFGPDNVGGIRISHMSHITEPFAWPLTVTKGKKKMYSVQPLIDVATIDVPALRMQCEAEAAKGIEPFKRFWSSLGGTKQKLIGGSTYLDELKKIAAKTATTELPAVEKSGTSTIPPV